MGSLEPVGQRHRRHPGLGIGVWSWEGGQSCRTEPLFFGIWYNLQVDSVRIELNCRTLSWCPGIAWWCGKKSQNKTHCNCCQNPSYQVPSGSDSLETKSRASLWSWCHNGSIFNQVLWRGGTGCRVRSCFLPLHPPHFSWWRAACQHLLNSQEVLLSLTLAPLQRRNTEGQACQVYLGSYDQA